MDQDYSKISLLCKYSNISDIWTLAWDDILMRKVVGKGVGCMVSSRIHALDGTRIEIEGSCRGPW